MAENRSKSDQYLLRLPPGLRERVKRHADYNKRSMNTEFIELIEGGLWEADMALMEQGMEPLRDISEDDRRIIAHGKEVMARIEASKREGVPKSGPEDDSIPFFTEEDALAFGEDPRKKAPVVTPELFDQLFGGSRLAEEVRKLREGIAEIIERPRREKLTEAEKEDIWRWLQKKQTPEGGQE